MKAEADTIELQRQRHEEQVQDIEQHNEDLQRGFKPRHVNMFAIAGCFGTSLIIGSGQALQNGGPGSLLITYCILGPAVYFVMTAFAEMSVFFPMKKGFSGYAARFCDRSLAFATGWNYFFKYSILLANNLTANGLIISYWRSDINVGVWVAIFGIAVVVMNCLPVKWFGELEFWFAIVKVIVLVGMILTCLVISCGGSPNGDSIGFRYWHEPGAFAPYIYKGSTGVFLGFWFCLIQAAFMYMGVEVVGITFGESKVPMKTIPRAIKQSIWRILIFNIGGALALGMSVPYNKLEEAASATTSAAASPFVVAMHLAGIWTLPAILNACFLLFTFSFANSDVYIASRTLYGLAIDGLAPAIFKRTTRFGVPIYAVGFVSCFIGLAFLNVSTGSAVVFSYFVSLSTVLGLINWVSIVVTYWGYLKGLQAQNFTKAHIPWRGPLQPWATLYSMFIAAIVILSNGFDAFVPEFSVAKFMTSYIAVFIYLINIITSKWWWSTKREWPDQMDLDTNRRQANDDNGEEEAVPKRGIFARVAGVIYGR